MIKGLYQTLVKEERMYALANVKKFVRDNADRLGDRAEGILARAEEKTCDGVFSGEEVWAIMQDAGLALEFIRVAMSPEHVEIGCLVIRAAFTSNQ